MIPNNERQKGQGWSRWNPLRLLVPKAWFDGRGDGGNSVAGNRSSGSQTIFTRSSITTLYGQEYPLSTELTDFLKINSSNDGRTPEIPGETIITALQDIAGDDERRWEARKLGGDSSAELASLLQCYLDVIPKNSTFPVDRGAILKLLQDICAVSGQFPAQYKIDGVEFDRRHGRIGCGGEAAIYRGRYNGKLIAVREISSDNLSQKEVRSQILREVITQWQVQDKNLLRLMGITDMEDNEPLVVPLIVMPYLGGGHPMDVLKTGTPLKLLSMLQGAASGLKHLHLQKPPIIHGDLHPDNLLLDDNGAIVLTDFGFSRIRHDQKRTLTEGGKRSGGNLRYIAPELAENLAQTTQRSDIFSLAMTFLALASLKPPFPDKKAYGAACEVQHGARPAMPHKTPLLNEGQTKCLWALLGNMWTHEPEHRLVIMQVEDELETSISPVFWRESPCRRGRAVSITAVVRPTKKINQPRTTPANPPDAGDAPAELRASVPRVPSASGIDWDKFPSNKSPERRLEDLSGVESSKIMADKGVNNEVSGRYPSNEPPAVVNPPPYAHLRDPPRPAIRHLGPLDKRHRYDSAPSSFSPRWSSNTRRFPGVTH